MTLTVSRDAVCKACNQPFLRFRPMQAACSPRCALKSVKVAKKAEVESTRAKRLEIKPRSKWLAEAQASFNFFVRQRDAHLPCISCGKATGSHWDAGHYLTRGARPELRFIEANCHKQCIKCNQHLHGNVAMYRVGLVARIGLDAVEALEGPHPPTHYSADDLRIIKHVYRVKARELTKEAA